MLYATSQDRGLRRRRTLIAVATAVALLVAAGTYALSGGHSSPDAARGSETGALDRQNPAPYGAPTNDVLSELAPAADPELFARLVAIAIFDWDTIAAIPLADYTNRLVTVADPTGESSPGLVADLAAYLPTEKAWAELRSYSTRQWLDVKSVELPSLWPQAETEAGPDGLLPGTTAYTIIGIRHRSGIWEGELTTSKHDVAFTVFIVCAPSYSNCHLLRLSRLDDPLD